MHGVNEVKKNMRKFMTTFLNTKWLMIIFPMLILGSFFLFLTLKNVNTQIYDIERLSRAKTTIRSPINIENEDETDRKMRETVESVEDRYTVSEKITEERIEYIDEVFDAILKIEEQEKEDLEDEDKDKDKQTALTDVEKIEQLEEILSPDITENLNDRVFRQLIKIKPKERDEGKNLLIPPLQDILNGGVRAENVKRATDELQQIIKYTNLNENLKQALIDLSEFAIVPNAFFDSEATKTARKEASSGVEPVMINAGEVIVREEQIITNEIYEELKLAGLLNKDRNIYPVVGLIIFILLMLGIIGYEMNMLAKKNQLDKGKIISIILISIIVSALMKIVSLYTDQVNQLYFAVPVATGVLLIKQLIEERLAIVLAILYALLGTVIFNGEIPGSLNMEAGIYFFLSQFAAIACLTNVKDRLAIVRAGIGMTAVNIVITFLFIFLSFEKYVVMDIFILTGFSIASALLSAVLTLGLLPFFETSLGILSDIKLLSLASPNHPLLRKLLIEAPGTYHHSIMVANLSEAACETIGANGVLARVGAYYHGIGKTLKPHYFIENQLSIKNPHDELDPKQSAEIIISHPYDGAKLLKQYIMHKEIIAIAMQHHGTTVLKHFYYKDKETNKCVNEADYRYPGPQPRTKEAAIICICDSVEAAVRSLKEPTNEKIEEIVTSIVTDRMMDGQFDESPLTFHELSRVHTTICETLKGIFHSRIQYPTKEEA